MDEPSIPSRLQDAKSALRALAAGHLPTQAIARSAASALDELKLALILDDDVLAAARLLRSIADGNSVKLDSRTQGQAQHLADFIADLADWAESGALPPSRSG